MPRPVNRLFALAMFAMLAVTGCVTPGTSASPGLGQVGTVDGLRVRPLAVVEDSRCPINVVCVWAGRIIVRTEVRGRELHRTLDMELGKPQAVAGGQLTLVAAEPGKTAGTATAASAYRFTFAFALVR